MIDHKAAYNFSGQIIPINLAVADNKGGENIYTINIKINEIKKVIVK